MTVKTSYAPGEPIWADLSTPDVDASRAFYGGIFGWTAPPGQDEFGGYTSFELRGHKVAGMVPLMSPEQPPAWSCYICTADATKTTELVESAGGTVIAPPMAVGDLGTMAVYVDAAGAFFGVWKPGQHIGAELVEEEGTLNWAELGTRDREASYAFYATVFGWDADRSPVYTEFKQDGTSIAGCTDVPPNVPAEVAGYWMPYFTSSDPAELGAKAESLGGTVVAPLMEFPGGRFCVVQDPQGATFGLLHMETPA